MKFEEEFPSLKNKMLDVGFPVKMDTVDTFCDDGLLCYRSDIKKHCVDKQKVKEAIEKLEEDFGNCGEGSKDDYNSWLNFCRLLVIFKKELGLD